MRLPAALALAMLLPCVGAEAAAVKVAFSATSDQFAFEPFAPGVHVEGDFILDLDAPRLAAPACPAGSECLDGAVRNARLAIDGLAFTADEVDVQLTRLGASLALKAQSGIGLGSVGGAVPAKGLTLVGAEFEARFAASYFPSKLAALDLKRDFIVLFGKLLFAPIGSLAPITTFSLGEGEFRSLVISEVPLPAAGWLFLPPVAALAGRCRPRSQA